jgi:DNA-binding NarL/FixJ family response regulator
VRPEQLADAVRVVADGETLLAPAITQRLVQQYVRRLRPGTTRPAVLDSLTERELAVLRLIARGRSNAEIAADLFLSETTVKTHVSHVFGKLGLRDRAQAVVMAYESGLIEPGAPPSS